MKGDVESCLERTRSFFASIPNDLEITVIALNGQITALVEHRDGTRYLFRRRIKLLIGSLNTFQRTHIEVCMAQNIYQESRRAR